MKVMQINYGRTFAGNNHTPREHIGQYENEKISIVVEATEDNETDEVLFEHAFNAVHKLQEDACRYRREGTKMSQIEELRAELRRLEENGED